MNNRLDKLKEILDSYDARYIIISEAYECEFAETKIDTFFDVLINARDNSTALAVRISKNKPEILTHLKLIYGASFTLCSKHWTDWYIIDE